MISTHRINSPIMVGVVILAVKGHQFTGIAVSGKKFLQITLSAAGLGKNQGLGLGLQFLEPGEGDIQGGQQSFGLGLDLDGAGQINKTVDDLKFGGQLALIDQARLGFGFF